MNHRPSSKVPKAFVWNATNSAGFSKFEKFLVHHEALLFQGDCRPRPQTRAWPRASTRRSSFSSHKSCGMNWFSRHSATALTSNGRNMRHWCLLSSPLNKGFRKESDCMWCDLTLVLFVSNRSSAFLLCILWIVLVTQLSAVLHAGSPVSWHNYHSFCPIAHYSIPKVGVCMLSAYMPRQ